MTEGVEQGGGGGGGRGVRLSDISMHQFVFSLLHIYSERNIV